MSKKSFLFIMLIAYSSLGSTKSSDEKIPFFAQPYLHEHISYLEKSLVQKTLSNGLRIIIIPLPKTYDVYVGITYGVGSGNETRKEEYGVAHVLEHMIFKGTKTLSESDIDAIAEKFGKGSIGTGCNAFTSRDMTHYHFLSDKQNWLIFLDILADSMANATLKQEHLDSEIKVILQEITKRNTLSDSIALAVTTPNMLFSEEHPYHHPIIGYPQLLATLTTQDLHNFYRQWYHPENATIILTGDINPAEALKEIEKRFSEIISPNKTPINPVNIPLREHFEQNNKKVYLQTASPLLCYFWEMPQEIERPSPYRLFLQWFLQKNLQKELIDTLHAAHSLQVYCRTNLLSNIFYIFIHPLDATSEKLQTIELQIPASITTSLSPTEEDLIQFKNQYLSWIVNTFDDYKLASSWANWHSFYWPTVSLSDLKNQVITLKSESIYQELSSSFSPQKMHTHQCLPIPKEEKKSWEDLQPKLDLFYSNLSNQINKRTSPVEPPTFTYTIPAPNLAEISFPNADHSYTLTNDLTIHHIIGRPSPLIHIILGLNNNEELSLLYDTTGNSITKDLTMTMLKDGTSFLNKQEVQNFFKSHGIGYSFSNHSISLSCPKHLVREAFGMLTTLLQNAAYPEDLLKQHINSYCKRMTQQQENGSYKAQTLLNNYLYQDYPWHHTTTRLIEQASIITRDNIVACQKTILTPDNFHGIIVGDIDPLALKELLKNSLEQWNPTHNKAPSVQCNIPIIENAQGAIISFPLPLKEIALCIGRLTTYKNTPDELRLQLLLPFVKKKLFEIREKTGLFYSCQESLHNANFLTKGCLAIATTVAVCNLQNAKDEIIRTLSSIAQHNFTEEEIVVAKHHVLTQLTSHFNSNRKLANTYSYLLANKLNWDYFDNLVNTIKDITPTDVSQTAQKYFNPSDWTFVQVGRIPDYATP